ncbi:hypothetical protein B7463_g11868, partial [Scytalidium lignicola]
METASSSSDSTTAGGRGPPNGYYHSKYGDITILNGQNYTEFKRTYKMALTVTDTIDIVLGTDQRPNGIAEGCKWDSRANKAIQIIVNSVTPGIQSDIATKLREKKLKETETIWQFIKRLKTYKSRLNEGITNAEIQSRLLDSLPADLFWETTHQHIYLQNFKLEKLITFLDINHEHYKSTYISTNTTQASVNVVQSRESRQRRGRGNRQGDRSRSNGRGQRGKKNSDSRSKGQEKVNSDQCQFCLKKGYFIKDCRQFQKAQARARGNQEDGTKEEHINTVTHLLLSDNDDNNCYLYITIAESERIQFAITTNSSTPWIVNSNATKYFTSFIEDFVKLIKRWITPKTITITNKTTVEALGHGEVQIKTTKSTIHINQVYIDFHKLKANEQLPGKTACEACLARRMKESFHKSTDNQTDIKGQHLHYDISGIKSQSIRGYKYFLLVTDNTTHYTWIRFLRTKESVEVHQAFKELLLQIEQECNTKVFLLSLRIQLELSPPYKYSLNGVIERMMQTVNKFARSMLYQAKLPHGFWCYATQHVVWLRNRILTTALPYGSHSQATTSYEVYLNLRHRDLTVRNHFTEKPVNPLPATLPEVEDQLVVEQEEHSTTVAEQSEALHTPIENSLERLSNSTAGISAEKAVKPEVRAGELTSTHQVVEPQVDGPSALVELEALVVGKRRYKRKDTLNPEIFKSTRSRRHPKRTVFSDSIVMMVTELQKSYSMPFEVFTA